MAVAKQKGSGKLNAAQKQAEEETHSSEERTHIATPGGWAALEVEHGTQEQHVQ